ncbi:Cysteine-rich repeat secretory protein 1 [Platanthera guangdongensis]|uniref:Cysteine-rich repeat secretory protein 1 n=1 Tax=Platanthera guangdongensis TaxID=2320717 RepID=A0ABR2LVX1_9ASPA
MLTMASSSNHQQLFFLLLALLLPIAINGADFIFQKCGENFTANAILPGNINSVLLDLVGKTSTHGFATSSYGTGADTIYGISECSEGATAQACSACLSDSALKAHTSCPNSADMSIWQHSCYLRYSKKNFMGQPNSTKIGAWYSIHKPVDQQAYTRAVEELLGVVGSAASWGENRKFGWGVMDSPNFKGSVGKLFAMVQCTWDLDQDACTKCLADARQIRRDSCGDRLGCYVITESCALRIEISAFLLFNPAHDPATPARSITLGSL